MSVTDVLLMTQSVTRVAKEVTFHVCVGRRSRAVGSQPNR